MIWIMKDTEQAQHHTDELKMLNEVNRAISSLRSLEEVFEVIFEQVRRNLPLDVFFIALYNKDRDQVTFPVLFDNGKRWQEVPASLQKAQRVARVLKTGQPWLLNRTQAEIEEAQRIEHRLGDSSRTA